MHQMVLGILRQHHQVADVVGVLGNLDAQGILHGAHRGQGVHPGTDTADTFRERPGVTRVAPLEDDFQAAPHGAGRHGVTDHIVAVDVDLDAQMALDTADRINHHALPAGVEFKTVGGDCFSHGWSLPCCRL